MNKLMVILGAVLMCECASAATVKWSGSEDFADSTGVAFSESRNIAAYLFDAADVTQADLFNSWNSTGTADLSGAKVTSTWYDAYELDVTSEIGSSGSKSLFWAVVNGEDLFVSSLITKDIMAMGNTYFAWADESANVFKNATAFGSAGWYTTEAVPEPTSGLLMLLGMAGLALKRKRA